MTESTQSRATDIRVASTKVSRRRNEHGEWVVRARDCRGQVIGTYFTDDKADAIATAAAMLPAETLVYELSTCARGDQRVYRVEEPRTGQRIFRYRQTWGNLSISAPGAIARDYTPEQAVGLLAEMGVSLDGIRSRLA